MGVTGIGGFFFRAKDPEAVRAWYVEHLGVGSAPYGSWETQAGPSVFAPFAADTDYFPADRQWMLNLRVDDLDGLCGWFGGTELFFRPYSHEERVRRMDRVTIEEVRKVARRVLRPDRLTAVAVGALESATARKVQRLLRSF